MKLRSDGQALTQLSFDRLSDGAVDVRDDNLIVKPPEVYVARAPGGSLKLRGHGETSLVRPWFQLQLLLKCHH